MMGIPTKTMTEERF